jgi:hypothetical protein
LEASCSYEEMRYLKVISKILLPPTSFYYTNPKLNYGNILIMLKNVIDGCKFPFDENDLFFPVSNAFVFFEVFFHFIIYYIFLSLLDI